MKTCNFGGSFMAQKPKKKFLLQIKEYIYFFAMCQEQQRNDMT